ncbi:MAG: hypothetical protein EXQ53_11270 [Acidobacteria bacterium]|nr:hypothetical protein [Acidobacteriota bacterium]
MKSVLARWIAGGVAIALLMCGVAGAQEPRVLRTPDRRPDLSGIWRSADNRYLRDLSAGSARVAFQPWAGALYKERRASNGKGRPSDRCLPRGVPSMMLARDHPWKIVQTPAAVIILFHESLHYRQIFTDGRPFPADAAPTWLGYSSGRWDGDALVAETIGLTDQTWLDDGGHPHSEALRVTERFRRRSVGMMDVDVTIDDPKAYTKPWTVTVRFELVSNADLGEQVCAIQPAP